MNLTTAQLLELDLSLRSARSTYTALSAILLPAAFFGIGNIVLAIDLFALMIDGGVFVSPLEVLSTMVTGLAQIGAEIGAIMAAVEANRRIRRMREDPTKRVRKMSTGFLRAFIWANLCAD